MLPSHDAPEWAPHILPCLCYSSFIHVKWIWVIFSWKSCKRNFLIFCDFPCLITYQYSFKIAGASELQMLLTWAVGRFGWWKMSSGCLSKVCGHFCHSGSGSKSGCFLRTFTGGFTQELEWSPHWRVLCWVWYQRKRKGDDIGSLFRNCCERLAGLIGGLLELLYLWL